MLIHLSSLRKSQVLILTTAREYILTITDSKKYGSTSPISLTNAMPYKTRKRGVLIHKTRPIRSVWRVVRATLAS